MRRVIVDSSVWIDYFAGSSRVNALSDLIDANLICVNGLILAELIPFLRQKKQNTLVSLLQSVENIPLRIEWDGIIDMQCGNLRHGIYKVGVPDLIIVQNAMQNDLELYSLDRHFPLMQRLYNFKLFNG